MVEQVREHVRKLLTEGQISAFLGLKDQDGNIVPYVFEKPEDLDDGFTLGEVEGALPARYPLAKLLMVLVSADPEKKFGILVRGCDERALYELVRWNQLPGAA
ncbi:MAG: 4Fe-4S ferredoxin, partial [Thermodesulfobacteriota bacterium]